MLTIGLTDHLEGPSDRPTREVFEEVSQLVRTADRLGVRYAWFAEHHSHAHCGHLPAPLLLALWLASQTRSIHLGTAVICLNLHHPRDVAEQVAVADVISGGRMAVGFGSGSTPDECALFDVADEPERERHATFAQSLQRMRATWCEMLPRPAPDLASRCWAAVNSLGAAHVAGQFNLNVLFSHLRTPQQWREYIATYRSAGGTGLIAANRPVFVGPDDDTATKLAEPAVRTLWRRFRDEGKIAASAIEATSIQELCGHPINFIVGGPRRVSEQIQQLRASVPFDVLNAEVRWAGLSHASVHESLMRLMSDVLPSLQG